MQRQLVLAICLRGFYYLSGEHLFNFSVLKLSALWSSAVWSRANRLCLLIDKFDTVCISAYAAKVSVPRQSKVSWHGDKSIANAKYLSQG